MSSKLNMTSRKDPVSMKLRVANMNQSEVKNKTKTLEEESRKMEERLRELKLAMNREKESREQRGGGYWKSGKQGLLNGHAKEVLNSKPPSKPKSGEKKSRKIKVLKDEPIITTKSAAKPGTLAFLAQRDMRKPATGSGPLCGQCDIKSAILTCQECTELYCSGCFTAFHLKGALAKHHSIPLTSVSTPRGISTPSSKSTPTPTPRSQPKIVWEPTKQHVSPPQTLNTTQKRTVIEIEPETTSSSLLEGIYDEREAAQSFQDALKDWRQTSEPNSSLKTKPAGAVKRSVRVVSPVLTPRVNVDEGTSTMERQIDYLPEFTGSDMTYAERLLLKANRRSDVPSVSTAPRHYDHDLQNQESQAEDNPVEPVDFESLMEAIRPQSNAAMSAPIPGSIIGIEEIFDDMGSSLDIESHFIEEPSQVTSFPSVYPAPLNSTLFEKSLKSTLRSPSNSPRSSASMLIEEIADEKTNPKSARKSRNISRDSNRKPSKLASSTVASSVKSTTPSSARALKTSKSSRDSISRHSVTQNQLKEPVVTEPLIQETESIVDVCLNPPDQPTPEPQMKLKLKSSKGSSSRPVSRTSSQMTARSVRDGAKIPRGRKTARPKSRAEIAREIYGEGTLTKDATPLKDVIEKYKNHNGVVYHKTVHTDILNGFFTSEVQKQFEERTLTPRGQRKQPGSASDGIQKYQISNQVYRLTGARSWKPDNTKTDTANEDMVGQIATDLAQIVMAGEDTIHMSDPDDEAVTMRYTWSASHERSRKNPVVTSVDPQSEIATLGQWSTDGPLTSTRVSSLDTGGRKSEAMKLRLSSARPLSAREVSAVVVPGDDMTRFDDHIANNAEDEENDIEAMNDLEMELASNTGRLTADGRVSRLLLEEEDDDAGADECYDNESLIAVTPRPTTPQTQRDIERLRESMMDDFEETELMLMQDEAMRVSLL